MIRLVLALLLLLQPLQAAELQLLSSHTFSTKDAAFGGFSGLHIYPDGRQFLATSDQGHFMTGEIIRTQGRITDVRNIHLTPILNHKRIPLTGANVDAEGLAVHPDGRIFVSFEANHRVLTFAKPDGKAKGLPRHRDFKTLQNNSSLEALAIDDRGWLYTIPERSGKLDRPFPVYRFKAGKWDRKLSLPRHGLHLVVGADFGPDGKFYLLERHYQTLMGFSTRIRRFTLTDKGFTSEETLLKTPVGRFDNLEGISVWRDDQDNIRITLISDDNFRFFQHTELVEYLLKETP